MRATQGPRSRNGVDAGPACVSAYVGPLRNDERYRVFEDCTSFRHARSGSNAKRAVAQEGTGKVAISRAPPAMGRRKVVSAPLAIREGCRRSQPGVAVGSARHMGSVFVLIGQFEVTEASEYLRVNGSSVRRNSIGRESHYDRRLEVALSVQRNEGDQRAPGVRAVSLVSWIGEGNARWSNGSAAVRANSRGSSVSAWQRASVSLAFAARPPAVAWRRASPARPNHDSNRAWRASKGFGESVARVPPGRTGCTR